MRGTISFSPLSALSLSLLAFDLNKHFLAPPSFAQYFICIPSLTLSYVDALCA